MMNGFNIGIFLIIFGIVLMPFSYQPPNPQINQHNQWLQTMQTLHRINDALDNYYETRVQSIYAPISKFTKQETCPNRPCVTASGQIATRNRTVACPRHIPLGTKVSIEQRVYICEDRTHYRFDGRWDIYVGDTKIDFQEALKWGVKVLPITILN